ncbi:Endonuclease/Exonuclease/phosphatase family protein [Histomonas meleagridis]|uniref:Endonuclease/Exonuclease/phosphatase family protein n=1 Tax=Histomonas meleagridis TaxID=135588 RepID=UPI0035599857|nr:Endonuclease/Exonuclease/phosphatase family protein [Histomonas meleagridis]KAH0798183.1 Endonuclease/Exonuclease/phosphatase family protein [Histomonas meleagridis]
MDAEGAVYAVIFILGSFLLLYFLLKLINKIMHGNLTTLISSQDKTIDINNLKIIQLNVSWIPNFLIFGKGNKLSGKDNQLLNRLVKYDVVCLTEAFAYIGSPLKKFVKSMRSFGFSYIVQSNSASFTGLEIFDGGLIILSKYPILSNGNITYQLSTGVDLLFGKGAIYARVQMGQGTHLHIILTNLQSTNVKNTLETTTVRTAQLREMIFFVKNKAMDGQPIIIVGNMNIDSRSTKVIGKMSGTEYNKMFTTLGIDGYTLTDILYYCELEHPITFNGQSLDYIFTYSRDDGEFVIMQQLGSVVKFENESKNEQSQHFGVEATIECGFRQITDA